MTAPAAPDRFTPSSSSSDAAAAAPASYTSFSSSTDPAATAPAAYTSFSSSADPAPADPAAFTLPPSFPDAAATAPAAYTSFSSPADPAPAAKTEPNDRDRILHYAIPPPPLPPLIPPIDQVLTESLHNHQDLIYIFTFHSFSAFQTLSPSLSAFTRKISF